MKINLRLLSLFFTSAAFCQNKSAKYGRVDLLFNKVYKDQKFNGNVLVVQKDQNFYEKSFGFADPVQKIALITNFKFQFGSLYKEFPAVAIVQLQDKGSINSNRNRAKLLTDLPACTKDISIKNLH